MSEQRKFTCYQDGVNFAHELAAKELEALPKYQEQALEYRRDIVDVLGDEINSIKDALQFMRDFALCCNDKSLRNKTWSEVYKTFFSILGINPKNSAGRKWSLKTVKAACDMIHGTSLQNFWNALDILSQNDKDSPQVHEFLKEVESSFIKHGYLKKKAV